jgi:hypothetical protein
LVTYLIFNKPFFKGKQFGEDIIKTVDGSLVERKFKEKGADTILNKPETEKIAKEPEHDIHFLFVGFDQFKLEQIVNLFIASAASNTIADN